jgi:hypothetical protein
VRSPAGLDATPGRCLASSVASRRPGAGKQVYRALMAQWKAQQAAKRPKTKLLNNDRLREYMQGAAGCERPPARRHDRRGSPEPRMERAELTAPARQAMGDGVEPGTDLPPNPSAMDSSVRPGDGVTWIFPYTNCPG